MPFGKAIYVSRPAEEVTDKTSSERYRMHLLRVLGVPTDRIIVKGPDGEFLSDSEQTGRVIENLLHDDTETPPHLLCFSGRLPEEWQHFVMEVYKTILRTTKFPDRKNALDSLDVILHYMEGVRFSFEKLQHHKVDRISLALRRVLPQIPTEVQRVIRKHIILMMATTHDYLHTGQVAARFNAIHGAYSSHDLIHDAKTREQFRRDAERIARQK